MSMKRIQLDRRIIDEIGNKLVEINRKSGLFSSIFHRSRARALKQEAIAHSYKIENHGKVIDVSSYSCHPSKRNIKKGTKNLVEAYSWGIDNFKPDSISPNFVKGIAGRVLPELSGENHESLYRDRGGCVKGRFKLCMPSEIEGEMNLYLDNLKNLLSEGTLSAILEAAVYSHLHLTIVHPFLDGNGRTARTMQGIILAKNNLPDVVIYPGERWDYFEKIRKAHEAWEADGGHSALGKAPELSPETDFYNYIAGRVSSSLDRLLDKK